MIDVEQLKADSSGRWPGIMSALGIKVGDGSHGPCPVCSNGKENSDRFRFDDKGAGLWYCNQGHPKNSGDGFSLIMDVMTIDFMAACKAVRDVVGGIEPGAVIEDRKADPTMLRKMFKESEPASFENGAGKYLEYRGIENCPATLRYHEGIKEPDTGKTYPAMLAVVTLADGTAATMHRTFLEPLLWTKAKIDKPKKLMPGVRKITGGAIRLYPEQDGAIGIAEGIETALACRKQTDLPVWSAVCANMLERFEPPLGIKHVTIFGDNDANFTGQKAAYSLANRLVIKNKIEVEVYIPDNVGDFLDK